MSFCLDCLSIFFCNTYAVQFLLMEIIYMYNNNVMHLATILQQFCECCRLMCAISLDSLSLSDVKKVCVLHTISKAWCLGRAIHRAQLAKTDPVMAVTSSTNGKLVISGKVCCNICTIYYCSLGKQ